MKGFAPLFKEDATFDGLIVLAKAARQEIFLKECSYVINQE